MTPVVCLASRRQPVLPTAPIQRAKERVCLRGARGAAHQTATKTLSAVTTTPHSPRPQHPEKDTAQCVKPTPTPPGGPPRSLTGCARTLLRGVLVVRKMLTMNSFLTPILMRKPHAAPFFLDARRPGEGAAAQSEPGNRNVLMCDELRRQRRRPPLNGWTGREGRARDLAPLSLPR